MSFLLDTCVLSQGIKTAVDDDVLRWLNTTPAREQFASVISLAEIKSGIDQLPEGKKKHQLTGWYANRLRPSLGARIIPFDEECAMAWVPFLSRSSAAKYSDTQIAATALVHGLTLVTRNVRDFRFPGLAVFNPWSK